MRIAIRRIGNARGMIIPTAMLTQLGLFDVAEVTIVDGVLLVRAPATSARSGWAEASKALAVDGDDALLLPEFGNAADAEIVW